MIPPFFPSPDSIPQRSDKAEMENTNKFPLGLSSSKATPDLLGPGTKRTGMESDTGLCACCSAVLLVARGCSVADKVGHGMILPRITMEPKLLSGDSRRDHFLPISTNPMPRNHNQMSAIDLGKKHTSLEKARFAIDLERGKIWRAGLT